MVLYKRIIAIIPVPYGSMLHIPPTSYHLPAAEQEPYQKSLSLNQKYCRIFRETHTHKQTNKQTTTTKNGHSRQKKKIRRKEQWEQADKQERRY